MSDLDKMLALLEDLKEMGVIDDYERCPGVDHINIFLPDDTDFQIAIVRGKQ